MPIVYQPPEAAPRGVLAAFVFGMLKCVPVSMMVIRSSFYMDFFQLANSIAHEMCHAYDWTLGPLNNMYNFYIQFKVDERGWSNERNEPTQVIFPSYYKKYTDAIAAHDRVYDAHGRWFHLQADKFNNQGLCVKSVGKFGDARNFRLISEDPDETPVEMRAIDDMPIKHMFDCIKASDKFIEYRDSGNWFIELH